MRKDLLTDGLPLQNEFVVCLSLIFLQLNFLLKKGLNSIDYPFFSMYVIFFCFLSFPIERSYLFLTYSLILFFHFFCCRYRVQSDRNVAVCSVHSSVQATLQCIGCVKAKIPVAKSYHCSTKCFADAWQHHRVLHDRATTAVNDTVTEDDELFGRYNNPGSGVISATFSGAVSSTSLTNGPTPFYPSSTTQRSGGETWFEVGRSKTYTPSAEDIGHVLKFECVVIDAETKLPSGPVNSLLTSRVIPAPSPSPRCLVPVSGVDVIGNLDSNGRASSSGSFTVLSYNILADVYATSESYSYCPSWALSWAYRRQNLLREIVGYHADIVCLQEV